MSAHPHRPTHIVIVGHDDSEACAVAGALARRLQRPLLDRTPRAGSCPPDGHGDGDADVGSEARGTDTLAWFGRTIATDSESVIAAPTSLLDHSDPPTRPGVVWTVLLEGATESRRPIGTDDRSARRAGVARRLCDLRVDTGGRDTDRIIDEITHAWERVQTTTETEQHHVR